MGILISKAVNGISAVLGSTFLSPLKRIFGQSCENICSGTWDIICFIENLCVSNLVKLLMVFILSYITLLFFYLLLKVGILQCIIRSLCKMTWAGCNAYCHAMKEISCFMWYKIKNVKRVHRGRRKFLDLEEGSLTPVRHESFENVSSIRERLSLRDRRHNGSRRSLYSVRHGSKRSSRGGSHHMRLRRKEVSLHHKSSGKWTARQHRLRHSRKNQEFRLVKKRLR